MVSYFGEVVHPSSRAFWTNDDDDEEYAQYDSQANVEFEVKWVGQEPLKLDKFIIVEGEIVTDFVTRCLLKSAKNVGTINYGSEKNSSNIYSTGDGIYFCTVSSKVDLAQASLLIDSISAVIKRAKEVFALTSNHISHFKSNEDVTSESVLKCLCSTEATKNKSCKTSILDQPNIITGVCAGVLSYREILHLPCIIYMLYTDTFTLDSKNALPLTELFSELLGKTLPNFTAEGSSFLYKENLYM